MQLSFNVKPELYQQIEELASINGQSIDDFVVEEIQSVCEEKQQAIKDLDELLEPAVIALNNGEVSDKTPDEILKEVMESVVESK